MSRDCCVALPHDVKEFFSSVCECIFFPDHTNLLFLQEPNIHVCLFCFVALRPKSTAMVIAGRSVDLTTLFPGQA